jgi:hypothetical protein
MVFSLYFYRCHHIRDATDVCFPNRTQQYLDSLEESVDPLRELQGRRFRAQAGELLTTAWPDVQCSYLLGLQMSCWEGWRRQASCLGPARFQAWPTFKQCEAVLELMHTTLDFVGITSNLIANLGQLDRRFHLHLSREKLQTNLTQTNKPTQQVNFNKRRPELTRQANGSTRGLWGRVAETQRTDTWIYNCLTRIDRLTAPASIGW